MDNGKSFGSPEAEEAAAERAARKKREAEEAVASAAKQSGPVEEREREPNLDSGYAWVILVVMFLLSSTANGTSRVYGLVYARQISTGYYDHEQASWPIATASTVENLAGILTPALAQVLSWRQIQLLSTSLFIASNLGAYFSDSLLLDVLCLGVVQGLALSTGTVLTLAINNDYFERLRTSAYGIAMSGSTCGVFLLCPMVEYILAQDPVHFRPVYLAIALVLILNLALSLFIKPRASTKAFRENRARLLDQERKQALVSERIRRISKFESHFERSNSIASINIETRSRRQSVLSRKLSIAHGSGVSPSVGASSQIAAGRCQPAAKGNPFNNSQNQQLQQDNNAADLLQKYISKINRSSKRLFGARESSQASSTLPSRKSITALAANLGSCSCLPDSAGSLSSLAGSNLARCKISAHSLDWSKLEQTRQQEPPASLHQPEPTRIHKVASQGQFRAGLDDRRPQLPVEEPPRQFAREYEKSGDVEKQSQPQPQDKERELEKARQAEGPPEPPQPRKLAQPEADIGLMDSFKLLVSPYIHCVWLMLTIYYLVSRIFIIILPDFGEDHGLTNAQSYQLLNYWSVGELLGRVLLASIIDLRWVSVKACIVMTCAALGLLIGLVATVESIYIYTSCSTLIAALVSLEYMLINALMVEYLGKNKAIGCYSIAALISSTILFARPTLIGLFRDNLGSYDGLLLLLSIICFSFALLFGLLEPLFVRLWPKHSTVSR